jgi:molybdenum cofactor cytidylyltransferase
VDYPAIKSETVAAMTRAWSEAPKGTLMIQPRYQGRHGHPVLFDSRLIEDFLALGPDCQARDVVHKYVPETLYIDVDDYGVTHDVDDPRAYMELLKADRQAL